MKEEKSSSKGKKKKKRKKNESEEEVEEQAVDSEEYSSKRGRKKKDRADREEKSSKSKHHQQQPEEEATEEQPTVEEVCEQFDLQDVEIEYDEDQAQNFVTFKLFSQYVRPILQKHNSKAQSTKLQLLTAAKWREFLEEYQNREAEAENSEEEEEEEEQPEPEPEYSAKSSRSRRGAEKKEEVEESSDDDKKKKKSGARSSKRGRKQKVPTLKIKIGKKKDQSSDEEKVINCILMFLFFRTLQRFSLFCFQIRTALKRNVTAMQNLRRC